MVGGAAMMGLVVVGGMTLATLIVIQQIQQANLPTIDPRSDAYSKCIGKFLTDMTMYTSCLDKHAGKTCMLDDNRMTSQEESHNCLGLITAIPSYTLNALVIRTAHDVCYTYLKSYGECFGLAVQIDDLEPCFRREVFARVGTVVDQCKNESGIAPDENVMGTNGVSIGDSFGPGDKKESIQLLSLDQQYMNNVAAGGTLHWLVSNGIKAVQQVWTRKKLTLENSDRRITVSLDQDGIGVGCSF